METMMFVAGIFLILAFVVFVFSSEREFKKIGASVFLVAFFVFLLSFAIESINIVEAGDVGVVERWGKVRPEPIESGIHFFDPTIKVNKMSIQTNNYWMSHVAHEGQKSGDDSISVRSSNGLQMPIDVSVPYRLEPSAAPWVYKNLGQGWVTKILRPAISTAATRASSRYTAEELYSSKRDEYADSIKMLLSEEIKKTVHSNYDGQNPPETIVVINQVLIGHVGIPETVKTAIEAKLKADQEQQAMEFTIMKAKKEKERKQIEAEGIQKFQEIVSKGIDDRYLNWKAIEASLSLAESHNAKVIIFGGSKNGLPIILNEKEEPAVKK